MDAVITYVNGLDPVWQESYARATNVPVLTKRYRDWGTLKYLLRGIETCLPFIRNVYLVVSSDSQVPQWADRSVLHVIRHEDIIPADHLPLFNSASIEMFLHRIPGLDEKYLYFNDDFFPVSECREDEFFEGDKAVTHYARHILATNLYKRQVKASDAFARKAAGLGPSPLFLRPQHICAPMIRSLCEQLYFAHEQEILARVSPLREPYNLCQYVFSDYFMHLGRAVDRRISNTHFSLAASSVSSIVSFLSNPSTHFACINDVTMPDDKFRYCQEAVLGAFGSRFPVKSRFEL